jgi:hypothetical protein
LAAKMKARCYRSDKSAGSKQIEEFVSETNPGPWVDKSQLPTTHELIKKAPR